MKQPIIKVGIISNQHSAKFFLHGSFLMNENQKMNDIGYTVTVKGDLICLHQEENIIDEQKEFIFKPKGKKSNFDIENVVIGIDFHWEQKEKETFEGNLLIINRDGKLILINEIEVEKYLQSVISSEMNSESPYEYLKAHSIISRSWLLSQLDETKNGESKKHDFIQTEKEIIKWYDREDHEHFDVCADDHCQRYQGITKIHDNKALAAVKETFGIVLTYEGKVCDTRYSKCCGGFSEEFQNVWQNNEIQYLISIYDLDAPAFLTLDTEERASEFINSQPEAYCNTNDSELLKTILLDYDQTTVDFFRWKLEMKQLGLVTLLKLKMGIDFGEIIELKSLERGKSGRIKKLKIIGSKKEFTIGKELEIRRALSEKHLYSSAFTIEHVYGENPNVPIKFILRGAGWGHGVGFCQIGGAVMASKGKKFEEILYHYFKNSKLETVY
ncbi:MAG: SpoIID/LytB domain-containing protein [Ignavibacteria bacterium]|nr:SpoIID/LytB domain-containing protein [Ignavibacteria bacterium]